MAICLRKWNLFVIIAGIVEFVKYASGRFTLYVNQLFDAQDAQEVCITIHIVVWNSMSVMLDIGVKIARMLNKKFFIIVLT